MEDVYLSEDRGAWALKRPPGWVDLGLVAILPALAALGLSLVGIGFGLPFLFRPDEDVMIGRAVHMVGEGSWDPLFYNYPPLAFYLMGLAESILRLVPGQHLGSATTVNPAAEYLSGRLASAAMFVASVVFTTLTALRLNRSRLAAVVAGMVLALSPIAVREAHFATVDMIQCAAVAITFWSASGAKRPRQMVLAGLACGAAAATKYTGGLALIPVLILAWGIQPRGRSMLAAIAGTVVGFAVPFLPVLGKLGDYANGLGFLLGRSQGTYGGDSIGFVFHPTVSIPYGLGLGAYALAIIGIAVAVRFRTRGDIAVLAYLAAVLVLLGPSHEVFFRYILPALPALALLAAGTVRIIPVRGWRRGLATSAIGLLLLPSLYAGVAGDLLLARTDTRDLAAQWMDANLPPGTSVGILSYWGQPYYGPAELPTNPLHPLYVTGDNVADSFQQGLYTTRFQILPSDQACYIVYESGPPQAGPVPHPRGQVVATFRPFVGALPQGAVYDSIDSFYLPLWGFSDLARPGPAIVIVKAC